MNGEKTFKKGEIPNDSQKEYHRFDRIATKMYGAAGSNAVDAGYQNSEIRAISRFS
jgi:hypothetical protein